MEQPLTSPTEFNHAESFQAAGGLPKTRSGPRDLPFAIAFLLHLVVIVGALMFGWMQYDGRADAAPGGGGMNATLATTTTSRAPPPPATLHFSPQLMWSLFSWSFVLPCVISVVFAVLFMVLIKKAPRSLIIGSMIFTVGTYVASALAMAIALQRSGQSLLPAIFPLFLAVLMAFIFYLWRRRIPFAAAILKTVGMASETAPGMFVASFVSLFVLYAWVALWSVTTGFMSAYMQRAYPPDAHTGESTGNAQRYVLWLFLVFSFYWTSQVIRNLMFCTCSGAFACWYFLGGNQGQSPRHPTLDSFKRAATTSFGSICLGSAIVAAIQTARAILRSMRSRRNALLFAIAECLLGCIEQIVRYFNSYAYVQVAAYGLSFCEAAKNTFALLSSHGLMAIINDLIINKVLGLAIFASALVTGGCTGVACYLFVLGVPDEWKLLIALLGGVIGMLIGGAVLSQTVLVVDAGVKSLFVLFAMDPAALARNDAALHAEFQAAASLV